MENHLKMRGGKNQPDTTRNFINHSGLDAWDSATRTLDFVVPIVSTPKLRSIDTLQNYIHVRHMSDTNILRYALDALKRKPNV